MEMASDWQTRTRGVRKWPNYGCESVGTPADGDSSQKDHAFRVGTFRCEAEPIANPGKFESIRFRTGHDRRATQSGSDQAGRLRDHNDPDLLGIREIQARLKQKTKRHRLTTFPCIKADQAAEWLRIRSMTSDAITDLNLWKPCSTGQQKIWNICSIRRQIGDCSTGGDEFSETSLALLKILTERAKSDRESGV